MSTRDTIGIDARTHEIYKLLTEGNNPEENPFKSMKDVFMWAALLGFQNDERCPLDGERKVIFRWAQLSPQTDIPLIKGLGLAAEERIENLLDQNNMILIAEEYANGGIHILNAEISEQPGQALWNIVNLIHKPE